MGKVCDVGKIAFEDRTGCGRCDPGQFVNETTVGPGLPCLS